MRETIRSGVVDPGAAWALVGDSDHMNRLAETVPLTMELRSRPDGPPQVHGTIIGPGPVRHAYVEAGASWVQGRWFRNRRHIDGPLLKASAYEVALHAEGDGAVVEVTQELVPTLGMLEPVVATLGRKGMRAWGAALDELERTGAATRRRSLPAAVEDAVARFEQQAEVDPAVFAAVTEWLRTARDRELGGLRPFARADDWGLDRRAVVTALLEATQAGLMEMYWTVRCVRCHGAVARADTLSNLADAATCPGCRIAFDADLAESVEVMFAAHKAVRPAAEERFCTLFPADRPETLALLALDAGESLDVEVDVPAGRWALGAGGAVPDVDLRTDGDADTLPWDPAPRERPAHVRAGPVRLSLQNPTAHPIQVQLAGATAGPPRLTAAWLTTMPRYRRTFGSAALARDVRIGVRAMAILFTDLTGSAALYHELGDAAAFRLVHDHFALLRGVIEACDGVVVKTIGDAVMAAFYDPASGVSAALTMLRHYRAWQADLDMERPPALKVGLHHGPVMAVHSDASGLDYFGETVNLAARTKGVAKAGEAVWTGAVHGDPGVTRLLEGISEPIDAFMRQVKGIPEPLAMHRWRAPDPTP